MQNVVNKRRANCLNLIRLLAAVQVVWGHATEHLNVAVPEWINTVLSVFPGVPIFFMLSGCLIWHSVGRSACFSDYAKKRFWRIYPELWVGVAVEIVVLLLLYDKPVPATDLAAFTVTQGTILQFWTPDSLRLYGCGTPNGSLWTIGVMVQFYILVWFLFKLLHGKKVWQWGVAFLLSIALHFLVMEVRGILPSVLGKLLGQTVLPYLWLFFLGIIAAEFEEKLIGWFRRVWPVCLALAVALILLKADVPMGNYRLFTSALLLAAWLGFAWQFPRLNIPVDISYPLYIYHMTVINAMITFGFVRKPVYLLPALVVSCVLAYLSTISVGKITSKMKGKVENGKARI